MPAPSLNSPRGLVPAVITWGRGSTATNTTLTSTTTFPAGINGYFVSGAGIPAGATVVSGQGTSSLIISAATTATASGVDFLFTAPPTLTQYPNAFQGMLDGQSTANQTISGINDSAIVIDFGNFVAQSNGQNVKAPTSDSDILLGFAQRRFKQSTLLNGTVSYAQYDTLPILNQGPGTIWCLAAENVNKNDIAVSITAGNGTVGGRSTTNANGKAAIGTPVFTGTGNGTLVMDATTPVLTSYQDGTYSVLCTVAGTNSATFQVSDPSGRVLGTVSFNGSGASATFSNQIKFAITDGATDFTVGALFTIAINAGRVAANGTGGHVRAMWRDTTAAGQLGRVVVQAI